MNHTNAHQCLMERNNIGFGPITLDIRLWKVLTPPTPKHTDLEAMSLFQIPLCHQGVHDKKIRAINHRSK
jgi:hypothetical protein